MTQGVADLLREAEQLSLQEREELADQLVQNLVRTAPNQVERAQIEEVRRRIAHVETGEVAPIPGEEALKQVRRLVASASARTSETAGG